MLGDLETDLEQRKELLTVIDEECDRINRLVNEASEIARLESGEMKLNLASHSIGDLIWVALADCRSVTSNREICLDVKHLDSRLLVDLSLAKRVLVHLIANAQLYSSPGRPITITTKQREKFHDISVADQGPGIEEEEIEHIFEKFYRGKHVRYRVPGTGMGLPIAKMIVEAHGEPFVSSTLRGGVPFSPSACQQNATGIRNTLSGTCAASWSGLQEGNPKRRCRSMMKSSERAAHPVNGWRRTPRIAPIPRNASEGNHIAVRFAYEWHDDSGN